MQMKQRACITVTVPITILTMMWSRTERTEGDTPVLNALNGALRNVRMRLSFVWNTCNAKVNEYVNWITTFRVLTNWLDWIHSDWRKWMYVSIPIVTPLQQKCYNNDCFQTSFPKPSPSPIGCHCLSQSWHVRLVRKLNKQCFIALKV